MGERSSLDWSVMNLVIVPIDRTIGVGTVRVEFSLPCCTRCMGSNQGSEGRYGAISLHKFVRASMPEARLILSTWQPPCVSTTFASHAYTVVGEQQVY